MKTGSMCTRGLILLAAFLLMGLVARPASAGEFLIDFETDQDGNPLAAGDLITDQFDDCFIVTGVGNNIGGGAMIFDSSNPTGGDTDLGTPNLLFAGPGVGGGGATNPDPLENILILTEDNDSSDPDDDARGGTITFDFVTDVAIFEVGILDIDNERGGTVTLYDNGAVVQSIGMADLGNNSLQVLDFGGSIGDSLVIIFPSSGAVTSFEFSKQIPEPAGLALCGLAVSGILLRRRRRARRS